MNSFSPSFDEKSSTYDELITGETSRVKLGLLLVEAKLVMSSDLYEALEESLSQSKPLGQVLVQLRMISQTDLHNALLAQSMISEGLVERHVATEALNYSHYSGKSFHQIISLAGSSSQGYDTSELESLLLSSDLVSESILNEAKRIAAERNISLSSSLSMMRSVSFIHLNYAFECLQILNQGKISKCAAISALRTMHTHNVDLAAALEKEGISSRDTLSRIKIGDILLAGKVVTENDVLQTVEQSISTKRRLGEMLIDAGLVSEQVIKDALILQGFCARDVLDKNAAAKLLRKAVDANQDLASYAKENEIFADDPALKEEALRVLLDSKLVTEEELHESVSAHKCYQMGPISAALANGYLSENVVTAAYRCSELVGKQRLSHEEAVSVLHACDRMLCSFEDAVATLGIDRLDNHRKSVEMEINTEYKNNKKRMPKLHKSSEFMVLISILVVVAAVIWIATHQGAGDIGVIAAVTAFGAIAILAVGQFWVMKVRHSRTVLDQKAEAAKQNMQRLSRLKK